MPEQDSSKKCSKCKKIKLLSNFYKRAKTKDGLRYECKACSLAYAKTETRKLSVAKYAKTEAGKASLAKGHAKYRKTEKCKRYQAEYQAEYTKSGARKLSQAKYASANPLKKKAQHAINHAIRTGRMESPDTCSECNGAKIIHGHHDNYAFPLVVRWLCQPCHMVWHTENGPGLNG